MNNIHNITASEAVQTINTSKYKGSGLAKSRQEFNIAGEKAALNPASAGKTDAANAQIAANLREAILNAGEAIREDIIARALFDAGIAQNEFTVEVVNAHINNFMPLTKENLERLILQSKIFDSTSLDILLMLNKAGVEVTPESIAQMERHVMENGRLTADLTNLIDIYSEFISSPSSEPRRALDLASLILRNILPENNKTVREYIKTALSSPMPADIAETVKIEDARQFASLADKLGSDRKYPIKAVLDNMSNIAREIGEKTEAAEKAVLSERDMPGREIAARPEAMGSREPGINILNYTDAEKVKTLIGLNAKNRELLMSQLKELVDETARSGNRAEVRVVKQMLGSRLLTDIIKSEISAKWFLDPKNLSGQEIKNKYNEINNDLKKILTSFYSADGAKDGLNGKLFDQAVNIRDNLNFIAQFNRDSFFIELPLKFGDRNINGEVYLLSDRRGKKKYEAGESVNILLKLTLERIGELDVFLPLQNTTVNTKFLSSSDEIISLISENVKGLRDALNEKGYKFYSKVTKEDASFDFANDFINKNTPKIKFKPYGFKIRI